MLPFDGAFTNATAKPFRVDMSTYPIIAALVFPDGTLEAAYTVPSVQITFPMSAVVQLIAAHVLVAISIAANSENSFSFLMIELF